LPKSSSPVRRVASVDKGEQKFEYQFKIGGVMDADAPLGVPALKSLCDEMAAKNHLIKVTYENAENGVEPCQHRRDAASIRS
jgi:hypothetical protein